MSHAAVALVVLTTMALVTGSGPAKPGQGFGGSAGDDGHFEMTAWRAQMLADSNAAVAPEEQLVDYRRAVACREAAAAWVMANDDGSCGAGADTAGMADCGEDSVLLPMWVRERETPASPWGQWRQIDNGGCGVDALPVLTAEDFRRLPIPAPALNVQPAADWVLVNKETIVYTDPSPVTLTTDLLGYQVTVEATPIRFTYDFGDGGRPLVTTDPGAPYPAFETFHVYRSLGTRTITLTTEWSGRYQVAGSPVWRDVDGTAQTTATSTPFEVVERSSKLVAELCTAVPTPADCR
ncbi:hypothetical protein ACFUMH_01125 [Cellulomonas sp. NPDC057328]|uniref:hypothetical protein n=1 Tax=Cellulomonas sp. NPDC057328 TaxID=3346101 RepID=UPI003636543D